MDLEKETKQDKYIKLKNNDDYIVIPDVCGPGWWKILHNTVDAIYTDGCSSCGEHAIKLMSFMHDLVNVDLDKKVYDPKNVLGFKKLVEKTFKQAEKELAGGNKKIVVNQPATEIHSRAETKNNREKTVDLALECNSTLVKELLHK